MAKLGGPKAQSSVIGVVLLLGITVASVGVMVTVGADSLDATSQQMELSSAEHALMELDSKITLVAHGGSSSQNVKLPQDQGSSLRVEETAGWMNITIVNVSTGEVNDTIANRTLGKLVYRNGETEIAYQNGGVWRYRNGGSVMISPPEAHYRGNTLTLPLIRINGSESVSGNSDLEASGTMTGIYPSESNSRANPLREGEVNMTVHSKYYEAWGDYFEQRTNGDVSVDHQNRTVTVNLVVPFGSDFTNAVGTSEPGGIGGGWPNHDRPDNMETGNNYPSPDNRIEEQISECESNASACNESVSGTLTTGKPYYLNSSTDDDYTFDTSGGNVTLVVNGSISSDNFKLDVTGNNQATLLLRDGMQDGGYYNHGGSPDQLKVLVHSDGIVNQDGSSGLKLAGLLYAPGVDCTLNGGPNVDIKGAIICNTLNVNGNTHDGIVYDESVDNIDMDLEGENTVHITYLHISETNVSVGP